MLKTDGTNAVPELGCRTPFIFVLKVSVSFREYLRFKPYANDTRFKHTAVRIISRWLQWITAFHSVTYGWIWQWQNSQTEARSGIWLQWRLDPWGWRGGCRERERERKRESESVCVCDRMQRERTKAQATERKIKRQRKKQPDG